MTVREALDLFSYGTDYEIKGAYSGKIYHRSRINRKEHAEKFYDETVTDSPFYATGRTSMITGTTWFSPVIGIWMHDYYLCNPQESEDI